MECSSVSTRLPGDSAMLVSLLQGVALGILPSQIWLWVSASAPCLSLSPLPSDGYSLSLRFLQTQPGDSAPFSWFPQNVTYTMLWKVVHFTKKKKESEKNGRDVYHHSTTSWNLKVVIRQFSSFDFLSHGWFSLVASFIHIFLPGSSLITLGSLLFYLFCKSPLPPFNSSSLVFLFISFQALHFTQGLSSPGSAIHRSLMSLLSVAMVPGLSALTCLLAPTRPCLYATHVPKAGATT